MQVKTFPNGIYGAATYLVFDLESREAVLVDCTSSLNEIKKEIENNGLNLKYILVTHGHFDHIYCLSEFKSCFPTTQILMHKDDMELIENVNQFCAIAGVEEIKVPCIDGLLGDESHNLKIGNQEIMPIHTKGHSKGGLCFLIGDMLFSGDTLFRESIGRCDLPGGSYAEIEDSIRKKLFKLENEIVVYPGHGPKTTIGFEKQFNPYFGISR